MVSGFGHVWARNHTEAHKGVDVILVGEGFLMWDFVRQTPVMSRSSVDSPMTIHEGVNRIVYDVSVVFGTCSWL
jgi:hypothetical protein